MVVGQDVVFYDPDEKSELFEARLSHIGKSIDQETKTIMCIAKLTSADRTAFVNGMFVETEIITCQREALAVPSEALIQEEERFYLLIRVDERDGDLILKRTHVKIGVVTQAYAELLSEGVTDVLVEGVYYLDSAE